MRRIVLRDGVLEFSVLEFSVLGVCGQKQLGSFRDGVDRSVRDESFRGSRPPAERFEDGTLLPFPQSGQGVAQSSQFRFGLNTVSEIARDDAAVERSAGVRIGGVQGRSHFGNIQVLPPCIHAGIRVRHEFFDAVDVLLNDGSESGFRFAMLLVFLVGGCGSQGSCE